MERKNTRVETFTLQESLQNYLRELEVLNYSRTTVRRKRSEMSLFFEYLSYHKISDLRSVNREMIESYREHLYQIRSKTRKGALSVESQRKRLFAVSSFFSFLVKKGKILYSPASDIDYPKAESSLPRNIFSQKEIDEILEGPDISKVLGLRDRSILELFYSTGIRRLELVNLNIYHIDENRETLFIEKGKNKKDRVVPIGKRALHWVGQYREEVRPQLVGKPDKGTLFLTYAGGRFHPDAMTRLVKAYVQKVLVNAEKMGGCHSFRHSMATLMLENGADIRYIQEMLGHKKLETTQIYTRVSIEKLKEVHARCHPGSSIENDKK